MGKAADVSPRRRNVRCPKCRELLSEPESPIYQCPFCFILLRAKGVPPDFRGESWQMLRTEGNQGIESSQQRNELEAKSTDGTEVIRSLRQVQLNDHEINEHVSTDGNKRLQEHVLNEDGGLVVENRREQELELENDYGNKSAGGNDVPTDDTSQISTANAEESMAVVGEEREGASMSNNSASPGTHLLLDRTIQQLPSQGAESCAIPSAAEVKKEFSGECDPSGEGDEENFQSEIIRDNDYELSFKYISSVVKSNDQLVSRKRSSRPSNLSLEGSIRLREPLDEHLTETRPFSRNESSNDSESYSSASESASNESVDSEFDFPSPSGQSMPPPNFSDELVPQKMPLPDVGCDAPPNLHQLEWQDDDHENAEIDLRNSNGASLTPHQLEWQDVDHKSEETPLQSSNRVVVSDEVDARIASDVLNEVDAKTDSDVLNGVDQVERTEVKMHLQNNPLKNETVFVGLDDTAATVREYFHVQGKNADLIGDPANVEGSVISKESDNAKVEKDCSGCQGSVLYELNKRKAMATTVPNSRDLLLPGAELLSKSKSDASLKEGTTNAGMFISGTEDPLCSLSDGSDFKTCLAAQKNINLVHSVVNVKLEDSIATIASKNLVFTGKASQANIDPHMICTEEIQERPSVPSHHQQNTSLSNAYNRCRRASTQGAAQNVESDSVGVQSFPLPLVTEPGDSSSHSAGNVLEPRHYYRRNYPSEATQGGGREDMVNTSDSRLHRRRTSLEETQMQSELSNKCTSQVQKNAPNQGVHMSRSRRILEESSNMHQRHAEVAYELADGQGPWLQKQNHQADMYTMQHSMNYSCPSNGFTPGNFQPFGSPYYANGSDSFAMGVPNASLGFTYQAPSHSWMRPPVMPGFHYGCHSAAPVCMTCINCQHSHMPQLPMPPCGGLCFNQSLPLAHQQGHMGWCNLHQAHQIKGPDQKASAVLPSQPRFPQQTVHLHDLAEARRKSPVSSARKLKHYPPLPQSSTAPYIICKGCDEILEVPMDIPLCDTAVQKVRCGACKKVAKFSVCKDNHVTHNAVLESATTNKVSQSMSHAVHYNKPGRPPPVPNVVQNTDPYQGMSSGLQSQYKQGSFDSQQQISAASKRRGSLSFDEVVQPSKVELDTSDQDEFFFRSLSRYSEIDSSRIFFNGFKAASPAIEANNVDGMLVGNVMDEKEEGLDFGAPRMSDGESLDQRSPESRMRSPENKQHFRLVNQRRHTKDSQKGEEYAEEAALDLKRKMIAEGKKPSASLFMLLNQQSSKFDIYRDKRVSFDESGSALFSTASSSPMDDDYRIERSSYAGDCGTSHNGEVSSSNRVGRTEPKSVMGMLRRSLKHFSRGH